jgi:hypothetical protein
VAGNAIRVVKCPEHFHSVNEQGIETLFREFVVVYFHNILIYKRKKKCHRSCGASMLGK